ncbi:MAG: hypothetical protein FWG73_08010 [Planctomycetaceae bacterium]|nr:hypothetical protein [Planctomycetaceae bacterium]
MYRIILLALPLCCLSGCLFDTQHCRQPNLFQPGYISDQQERTWQFDPFASPTMGPKIVGDRPHGALDPSPRLPTRR